MRMKHGPVYAAIVEVWGERCPDYDPDCLCCRSWADYDRGAAVQWRPIEEAPKDGTPLLLLWPDAAEKMAVMWWDGYLDDWVGYYDGINPGQLPPTHWMPLPPPPKGAEE